MEKVKSQIEDLGEVISVHDLHVWQLVDGLIVCSVHVLVEVGCDFNELSAKVRRACISCEMRI